MKVIEVTDLTKRFNSNGISFAAVDKVSFTVEEREIFALLGPNGAGKTTLIKILTTLLKPTSGMAKVAGFDVSKDKERVRASIGIVFQEPALDWRLTGRENLDFHARMYGIKRGERERRVAEALKLVELEEKADIVVDKYSGGMKRRFELARGFIHHPKVLFLDEPTLGLDTQTRRRTWDYIKELNERERVTIVLTTHYMEEADYLCDRVGIIDQGKIIVLDSPKKLMDLIGSDLVTLEMNTPNAVGIFENLDFVTDVQEHNGFVTLKMERADLRIPTIMEHARESGLEIKSVNMRKPSLEDVFLHFTGRRIRE
ncbi:MAG TPA: ATP-binding cassette domain-containing protein [Methanophagales archaeon]|nr:ATP-binding cassette domain-containing protein [Methanophagales archaeon]